MIDYKKMKKKILGLDLGTNSIGWALVDKSEQKIVGLGARIVPIDGDLLGDFEKGNKISQTAVRTQFRVESGANGQDL